VSREQGVVSSCGIQKILKKRKLEALVVCGEANLQRLLGYSCDNGVLVVEGRQSVFYTDFRYAPEARRKCRGTKVRDIRRLEIPVCGRIGYEGFIPHARFLEFVKLAKKAKFVDVARDLLELRAIKTPDEIAKIRAAERLDCDIYDEAVRRFRPGMTERKMAATIKKLMIDRGEGEAFETIVCIGKNAAECHHVPDDTVWNGREPVLIDMGVKLDGYCSDLTRNILPGEFSRKERGERKGGKVSGLYGKVFELVKAAQEAAIAAAKPGISGKKLDRIAREVIRKGGFGKCFGHSLGHGVGLEIHEAPNASTKSDWILKPGMVITIEPGIYLEDNLGVRIEDLILITEDGCEVLSR